VTKMQDVEVFVISIRFERVMEKGQGLLQDFWDGKMLPSALLRQAGLLEGGRPRANPFAQTTQGKPGLFSRSV